LIALGNPQHDLRVLCLTGDSRFCWVIASTLKEAKCTKKRTKTPTTFLSKW
jgi:hypothetical protein